MQFFRQPIVNFLVQAGVVLVITRFLCYTDWLIYFLNQPHPPLWDFQWYYVASKLAHRLSSKPLEGESRGIAILDESNYLRPTELCRFRNHRKYFSLSN
ncbi:MAG: hypothetical protein V7K47_22845 [Nostoc sp.]